MYGNTLRFSWRFKNSIFCTALRRAIHGLWHPKNNAWFSVFYIQVARKQLCNKQERSEFLSNEFLSLTLYTIIPHNTLLTCLSKTFVSVYRLKKIRRQPLDMQGLQLVRYNLIHVHLLVHMLQCGIVVFYKEANCLIVH